MYLASFLLENNGSHEVYQAVNGESGLKLAQQEKPDLILLDIQLPDIDGHQVARKLKADPELSSICIIALTAFAMPGDAEKAYAAGCDGFLTKPIDPDTFIEDIHRIFNSV